MKQLIPTLSLIFLAFGLNAQNNPYYNFAIGARAGSSKYYSGVTAKFFMGQHSAMEVLVAPYKSGISTAAFYEHHVSLFRRKELQFYFGGGAHFSKNEEYQTWTTLRSGEQSYLQVHKQYGFDAIAGIEYKFLSIPLAVSLDLRPNIEFSANNNYALGLDQGLGVKLAF